MTRHTPGPWEIDEGDGMPIAKVSFRAITAPGVAHVGAGLSRDEIDANARLIAAAPDLLEGLTALLADPYGCRFCDSGRLRTPNHPGKGHDATCGFVLAHAAIERATGGGQ